MNPPLELWSGCPVADLNGDLYDVTVSAGEVRAVVEYNPNGGYPICPPASGGFGEFHLPAMPAGDYTLIVTARSDDPDFWWEWEYGRQAFTVLAPVDPSVATVPSASSAGLFVLGASVMLLGLRVIRKSGE